MIYFDAFEHDYLDDPLISLVGAVLKPPKDKLWSAVSLQKIKSSALRLVKPGLRIGLALS